MLRELGDCTWARLFTTEQAADLLFAANRYPIQPDLQRTLHAFGNGEFQPRDIIELVNALLQRVTGLEQYLKVAALLVARFRCNPALNLTTRHSELAKGLEHLLACVALLSTIERLTDRDQLLLTRGVPACPRNTQISASIADFEGEIDIEVPLDVEGVTSICQRITDLHQLLDVEKLWVTAPRGTAQVQALNSYVWVDAQGRGIAINDALKWTFGDAFLATAEELGFLHETGKIRTRYEPAREERIRSSNVRALRHGGEI
jgi:hypothetical protein